MASRSTLDVAGDIVDSVAGPTLRERAYRRELGEPVGIVRFGQSAR